MKEHTIKIGSGTITLYHGSKGGINGNIKPDSRSLCDFGKGFYMGTDEIQPLTLICNFPNAKIYKINCDLNDLKILDLDIGLDWALLIAYYRGKMESAHGNEMYTKYATLANGCDMIVGYIANDRMFVVLDRFFAGDITDKALINSLATLKLGKQYVALTEKACNQIEIIDERTIGKAEQDKLRKKSEFHRLEGIRKADEICREYRRDGLFFDEIVGG